MGRAGYCINHSGRPADNRCIQCHKPLCDDCVIHDEGDAFCSKKCLSRYRTFHRSYEAEHARTPLATIIARIGGALLVLLVVVALIYIGGEFLGIEFLKGISGVLKRIVF